MNHRKPQDVIDRIKADTAARLADPKPWDPPATCEICTDPQACYEGRDVCELSGEKLVKQIKPEIDDDRPY